MLFENSLKIYDQLIDSELKNIDGNEKVTLFYDPIRYILELKGKRIRPLLTLLTSGVYGIKPEDARFAATAVELLHNFTLVHDDIMDNDGTRRGKPTIHVKWDLGTGILAGDGLIGLAFKKLIHSPYGDVTAMVRRFTDTMIVICEGQGLDKMFEKTDVVDSETYLDMISRKTAVLIELACELGGMVAETDAETQKLLREFGYALGMGFQIQDDLLDIIADEKQLGKKLGSDLKLHKKTILTILLREETGSDQFFDLNPADFKALLNQHGLIDRVTRMYENYFTTAWDKLHCMPENTFRKHLEILTDKVKNRSW
jgi:geranylgeranyl diphosphate synthase type II